MSKIKGTWSDKPIVYSGQGDFFQPIWLDGDFTNPIDTLACFKWKYGDLPSYHNKIIEAEDVREFIKQTSRRE